MAMPDHRLSLEVVGNSRSVLEHDRRRERHTTNGGLILMAVRRVRHHGGNVIGQFPSIKLARMVWFESLIERDLLYLLDFEPEVCFFGEQPLTIEYVDAGKPRHYTPDFQIVQRNGRNTLVECKPSRLVATDDNLQKFSMARAWCAERDWDFRIVTDEQLRAGFRLANIKQLTGYARHVIAPRLKERVYAILRTSANALTVGEIAQQLTPQQPTDALVCLWHMAFHHEVVVALDSEPLSRHSAMSLSISETRVAA